MRTTTAVSHVDGKGRPAVSVGRRDALALVRGNSPGLCGELLGRADAHLLCALEATGDPVERFLSAYQAALRGAGALLAAVEPAGKRLADRSAWTRLGKIPGFERWAEQFCGLSKTRAMLQVGIQSEVAEQQVHELVRGAGEFLGEVEDFLRAGRSPHAKSA